LKICASVASTKAVAMPSTATHHIQKIAPGPPSVSAIATPAMLPVPTREARPTAKAWKEEMPPFAPPREAKMVDQSVPKRRNCTKPVCQVNQSPAPISR
jgi:hypothetical protein